MFDSKSVDLSTLTETLQALADIMSRQSRRRGALPMIPAVQPVTEDGVIERLAEIQRVVSLMADNLRNDARENLPTTINLTSNGLQEALQQIERELSRIRPEQFRGSGTVSVQHTPNGINIHGRSGDADFVPQHIRRMSFPAKLTGAAAYAGSSYRWKYAWEEVVDDGDDIITVTNGRSGTTSTDYALNDFERFHTSTIAGGVALDGDDYPAGFAPMPIGGAGPLSSGDGIWRYAVVVNMHERWDATNSKWVYRFSAPISHDGTCEAAT